MSSSITAPTITVTSSTPWRRATAVREITIATAAIGLGLYEARLDGRLLCRSRTPFLDAARVLLSEGYDPSIKMLMLRAGSNVCSLTAMIGAAAKLSVEESANGPVFRSYRIALKSAVAGSTSGFCEISA